MVNAPFRNWQSISRGLGLFITERSDFTEKLTTPGVYTRKR